MASETVKDGSHREPNSPPLSVHGGRGGGDEDGSNASPHSDNASSDDHVGDKAPPVVLTKRQKLKRHCGRFWWYYLIGLIILLAILLPILFKVIIPVIVQNIVKSQKLPVEGGALRALSPTQLIMTLNTSLDAPLPVRVAPTNLELYNRDTKPFSPFVKLNLPGKHVHHKTEVLVANQTVTIDDEKELVTWFNEFFDLPQVKLSVHGEPKVYLGALKYSPDLDKTIEVPSLSYLKGFGVEDMQFLLPEDGKGHNMKGHLNLPNSGVLTLGLGNLTFNLMSGKVNLGIVKLYNVNMKPGRNIWPFDGVFYFKELVPNLAAVLDSQKIALSQGSVEFNATGNSTFVNGQRIKYLENVLNYKHITFRISVITLLSDVLSGLLDGNKSSLLDIFGDVLGNSTLLEHIMDHWDTQTTSGNETNARTKLKRAAPKGSLMWNMLRLGLQTRK